MIADGAVRSRAFLSGQRFLKVGCWRMNRLELERLGGGYQLRMGFSGWFGVGTGWGRGSGGTLGAWTQ